MTDSSEFIFRLKYFTNIFLQIAKNNRVCFEERKKALKPIKLDGIIRRLCEPNRQKILKGDFL